MIFVQHEYQYIVAKHFRVTSQCISKLICSLTKRTDLLSEWLQDREEKIQRRRSLKQFVDQLAVNDEFIDSSEAVAKKYQQ